MDLMKRLSEYRAAEGTLRWEGPFSQYFELVQANPKVGRLAHARVFDMIRSKGVTRHADNKPPDYGFFEGELYGLEETLDQVMDYFASAAERLDVRKRILLLMGPVGGGKSTIAEMLKRGLEQYTRTSEGAVYAIQGCPMHEEPLHLVPEELRQAVQREFKIYIEGDLCPHCRHMLASKYQGVSENVIVERIIFSEKERKGIGTFTPSDPKSQDISELVGGIDLSTIGEVGVESDPRAYRFDGELNIANRGLMEFIEMLKCDEKFLYVLLSLAQEQNIKTGRFSMIYADEVVVSHTNEHEYQGFVGNKKSEALQDRIVCVRVPYNLRVSQEVRIYEKLLRSSALTGVHIAPHTLRCASYFAILSRLEAPKKAGMTLIKKLRVYDGESVDGVTEKDVKDLKADTVREGMEGISPRYVINRLSSALIQEDKKCINPIDALRSLKDGLDQQTSMTGELKDRCLALIDETRREYDDMAKTEVQKAFVYSFEDNAATLLGNYLDNIEAFCNKRKIRDPITEDEVDPDEKLMRSIEEQIGITDNAKKTFREEILIRMAAFARKGEKFHYSSHERLREAIEKKLFADLKDLVKVTTSTKTPDENQLKKVNEVVARLVDHHGYCPVCANALLRYVGTLLNR